MRKVRHVAMLAVLVLLPGCMTQQGPQSSAVQDALLKSFAQGLISGAGASLAHGIASGNERLIAAGAAQAALGAAAAAGAASARPPAASTAGNAGSYPDTPQCRAMWQFMNSGVQTHLAMGGRAAYARLVRLEHECLASAPNHPMSRSRACGNGRYLHYIGPNTRGYCGWRAAAAAFGSGM